MYTILQRSEAWFISGPCLAPPQTKKAFRGDTPRAPRAWVAPPLPLPRLAATRRVNADRAGGYGPADGGVGADCAEVNLSLAAARPSPCDERDWQLATAVVDSGALEAARLRLAAHSLRLRPRRHSEGTPLGMPAHGDCVPLRTPASSRAFLDKARRLSTRFCGCWAGGAAVQPGGGAALLPRDPSADRAGGYGLLTVALVLIALG